MHNWSSTDYPEWYTEPALATVSKGYTLPDETPIQMYRRVAKAAAFHLGEPEMEEKFFEYMWCGWLCPASPVLSNAGTKRGMPISCFGLQVEDSIVGIYDASTELGVMTKNGGGVGMGLSFIRGRGSDIAGGMNGQSEGVVPWAKRYDTDIVSTSQGGVRRGAASVNLDVRHTDIEEFLRIRRPKGDINRQCLNLHHCVVIDDLWMQEMLSGDDHKRYLWTEILRTRLETGEPYVMFKDAVNRANPYNFKALGLDVTMTNICTEITLPTDELHAFICCLSSLNLARWEEWKDTDLVEVSIAFLNGILNEFIARAEGKRGLERAVRSAVKGRAIGLGVLGWHTLLQKDGSALDSLRASLLNRQIFSQIQRQSKEASQKLAKKYGEPEWCKGTGMFNTHLTAIAPTRSNATIAGGHSNGQDIIIANAFADKSAKGVFTTKNPNLERLLQSLGKDNYAVWSSIVEAAGSVQHLDFLTKEQKDIFKTAYEVDQRVIVRLAAERQQYIDQAQSLNLYFHPDVDPRYFHAVHKQAWESGVKTLYYCRSNSVLKADAGSRKHIEYPGMTPDTGEGDCTWCEG